MLSPCNPADKGSSAGDVVLLDGLERLELCRDRSSEPRGPGERGRGFVTEVVNGAKTLGKENERSDVGVESSTAAVLVGGRAPVDCWICWS